MENIIDNLTAIAILIAVAAAFGALIKVTKYAKENAKNETVKTMIGIVENIVSNSVEAANQKFVDGLKKEGKFDKETQKKIFKDVKTRVLEQLNSDTKNLLDDTIGNTNFYISDLIDKEVRKSKKGK